MGIRESLLNTITSVADSDFVRIVTSAGASSKATLQNVIKSFETGLGAKTSLTTSDYIRVVGSDNNLYKQSLSGVVETINGYNNTVTRVSDCNDATDPSKIYYADGNTANRPANAWWFIRCEAKSDNMLFQTAYFMNATDATVYQRSRDTNGTWGAWAKVPTREEMDAMNAYSSNPITLNSNAVSGGNNSFCYKRGNTVTVFLDFRMAQSGASATVATLPSGYRPPINIRTSLPPLVTGTDVGTSYALIQASGDIIAYQGNVARAFLLVTFSV